MQDVDVLYLYEHEARDLDIACAVKCIAERAFGIKLEVVQFPRGLMRAARMRPKVVVVPYCYTEGAYYSSVLLQWRKSIFFNLASEQLLYNGNRDSKTPRGEFARKHVIHHAWGDFFADYLKEKGVPNNHIFVNGNPAYTLYHEPYCRFFGYRGDLASRHGLDPNKKWIFFPENYIWAFYGEEKLKILIQREPLDPEVTYAMRDFCHRSLEEAIKWSSSVALSGKAEIVIRPRPSTPLHDFKNFVHQVLPVVPKEMHLINDGTIREWIMASDVVVSSYSTSLIEAAIAGKPVLMLEPYPVPPALQMEWHGMVKHCRTQADFEAACLAPEIGEEDNRLRRWAQQTMMANGDAIWNLADFVVRLCRGEAEAPPYPTRKSVTPRARIPLPAWFLYEYRRLRWRTQMGNPGSPAMLRYGAEIVNAGEIRRRIEQWSHVLAGYHRRKSVAANPRFGKNKGALR